MSESTPCNRCKGTGSIPFADYRSGEKQVHTDSKGWVCPDCEGSGKEQLRPPQDDVGRLREKLKTISALLAMAAPAVCKARSTGQPGLDAALMTVMDAVDVAASDPAPDVERLGGEEGLREALEAEVEQLQSEAKSLGPQPSTGVRLNVADRLQAILDANPPPPLEHSKGGLEERSDDFCLCLNCGVVGHQDDWTLWQPDPEHEHGEADYRPHGLLQTDSDALLKCPRCGEMHGDGYIGAGIEEGTRAQVEAVRGSMLAGEGQVELWADALAAASPRPNQGSDQPKEQQ